MEVKWLRKALENLNDHASYIARDNPSAAKEMVNRINHCVNLLLENPALGHPGRVDGTRELIVPGSPFIIPYRYLPNHQRVEILRVFHTSRKTPDSWQ